MRRLLARTIAVATLLLAVPAAHALPGDPPPDGVSPADGATLTVESNGIPVRFACPLYRSIDRGDGFVIYGATTDYAVLMATSATTGTDGRLADRVAIVQGRQASDGICDASLGAGGAQPPQETPGTYFWQVTRICTDCTTGYEVGPVRRFVLRSAARPQIGAVRPAYATYPVLVPLVLPGVPDGVTVLVERRSGSRWVRAGSATALGGRGDAVVTVTRAGTATLRATVADGAEVVEGAARNLTVRPAVARRTTSRRDDGAYRGTAGGERSPRFRVVGGGRELRAFSAFVTMTCPGVQPGQFTVQIGTAKLARVRVAPDGRFVAASTPEPGTAIRLRGRLKGRRVSEARIELSVGSCVGNAAFAARRAR